MAKHEKGARKGAASPDELAQLRAAGITLSLDETGRYPTLIVSGPRAAFTKPIVCLCHFIAGEQGAEIRFNVETAIVSARTPREIARQRRRAPQPRDDNRRFHDR